MIRLKRTYHSLRQLDVNVDVFIPYHHPQGQPRILKGIVRYILIMLQLFFTRAEIYHVYNVPDVIAFPIIFKTGKLIYDVRSPWFSSVKETLGIGILWRAAKLIEFIITKSADIVLTANTPLGMRAKRWGAKYVSIVPNYPPSNFGDSARDRESMRAELNLGDSPTVLFLGKIAVLEGSDLLKTIIAQVCASNDKAKFLIVGDGPQRKRLERFVADSGFRDCVIFTGWVHHSRVPDFIVASDICLLPRKHTSFSSFITPESILKAGEYLALGRPVVAPKMGGFASLSFPVIAVEPSEMGRAVIDYFSDPIPVNPSDRPTWAISHERLRKVYKKMNAL